MLKPNDINNLTQDDLNRVIVILTDLCRLEDIDSHVHGELCTALNILDPEDIKWD